MRVGTPADPTRVDPRVFFSTPPCPTVRPYHDPWKAKLLNGRLTPRGCVIWRVTGIEHFSLSWSQYPLWRENSGVAAAILRVEPRVGWGGGEWKAFVLGRAREQWYCSCNFEGGAPGGGNGGESKAFVLGRYRSARGWGVCGGGGGRASCIHGIAMFFGGRGGGWVGALICCLP